MRKQRFTSLAYCGYWPSAFPGFLAGGVGRFPVKVLYQSWTQAKRVSNVLIAASTLSVQVAFQNNAYAKYIE